jgi:Rha family phage regulatory protein
MNDLSEFVTLNDAVLTTDSQRVAKHFKKLHKNVLRAYDRLDCSEEFNRLNFEPVEQSDGKGEDRRVIRMTKNGFVFLVMGFRGAKAARIKEEYIAAFDSMGNQLQQISMGLWNQRLELEKKDATTFMWASFGAHRMNDRRRALPDIKETRERLEHEMQPTLFHAPALTDQQSQAAA